MGHGAQCNMKNYKDYRRQHERTICELRFGDELLTARLETGKKTKTDQVELYYYLKAAV